MYLHGRVQISVELRSVFFLEDMTYTCTSFKKDLLRGVCYNIPLNITSSNQDKVVVVTVWPVTDAMFYPA